MMPLVPKAGRVAAALVLWAGGIATADAVQRTFVATSGSDASACNLAAPCRTFAKAITLTDPGGEIIVLDSGGYGGVTVDKSLTITSPAGVYAGVSVPAGNDGIVVAAPAAKVVLRGLTINGQGGSNGVRVQAGEVHLENLVISNMAASGILVEGGTSVRVSGVVLRSNGMGLRIEPLAGAVTVAVRDSEISNNTIQGVLINPVAGGSSVQAFVERSTITKNQNGLALNPQPGATATLVVTQSVASDNVGAGVSASNAGATAWVRESAITRNGTGLAQSAGAALNACGANLLVGNAAATSGAVTINAGACLDQMAGPSPASSVVAETTFGLSSSVGAAAEYARADHTHGTPALPALAGDVNGSMTGNTVTGLQGRSVASTAPANGSLLAWNGSSWSPTPDILRGYQIVTGAYSLPANFLGQLDVGCPAGKSVLGGGMQMPSASVGEQINIVIRQSFPVSASTWRQLVSNVNASTVAITVYATCAST